MKSYIYKEIFNLYNNNLLDKLRDFKVDDNLSVWVPHEDITLSLLNLFDASEESKIQIKFDKNQFKLINFNKIKDNLINEGNLAIDEISNSIIFQRTSGLNEIKIVPNLKKKIYPKKKTEYKNADKKDNQLIKDEYLLNLKKINFSRNFEKKINPSSMSTVSHSDDICELELLINPMNHIILDCYFLNKNVNATYKLFGIILLNQMVGLPIQEIKDHLLTKFEFKIRPRKIESHTGVILKHKGGTIFNYFQEMINKVYLNYTNKNNIKFGPNFYMSATPDIWKNMNKEEKSLRIIEIIKKFNEINKSSINQKFELSSLAGENRVFLKTKDLFIDNKDNYLFFEIENFLNKSLNMKFEVYYVNREDENKMRKK